MAEIVGVPEPEEIWRYPKRLGPHWSGGSGVWWHGDRASVDADGQWLQHGRSDDAIKLAGKRLGPAEVETVLVEHPSVVEAAVVPGDPPRDAGAVDDPAPVDANKRCR